MKLLAGIVLSFAVLFCTKGSAAQYDPFAGQNQGTAPTTVDKPPQLQGVEIDEHLGRRLPADAIFHDTEGKMVHLGDFFDQKRPTLFVFAYHTCPMLCSLVLDATVKSLKDVPWTVGDEFDVVSVSIDPRDTPQSAKKKEEQLFAKYGRGKIEGWHFLTGDETNIKRVTDAVGFKYWYDERQGQYAHPAAIYLLTPPGAMARYLYGIEFDPKDIRLGLLEASEGRSISTTEKILLYCYHYDPQGKKYSIVAMNVMRLGGAATAVLLGGFLAVLWLRERRKKKAIPESHAHAVSKA
jgi:protein SCO1/2